MNIIEAVKSGRAVRRTEKTLWHMRDIYGYAGAGQLIPGYITQDRLFSSFVLEKEDILAEDWEVEPVKREISADDVRTAYQNAWDNPDLNYKQIVDAMLKELGLE